MKFNKTIHGLLIGSMLSTTLACGRPEAPASDTKYNPVAIGIAINVLSGVVLKLFDKGIASDPAADVRLTASKIGEALPKDAEAENLSQGERVLREFDVAFADGSKTPIKMKYRIVYVHNIQYKGVGKFISDVQFVPVNAVVAKGYGLSATAVSQDPVKESDDPSYSLDFTVSFNLKTPADSRVVTHSFRIRHPDGKLIAHTPSLNE